MAKPFEEEAGNGMHVHCSVLDENGVNIFDDGGEKGTALLQTVPGLGPELAQRIHDELHVDTLEGLENAAYDGSLERIKGMGERRLSALRASLATMLGRPRKGYRKEPEQGPEAALLLEVDRLYREGAQSGELPRIAPKRFNPTNEAWLPVLHIERGGWHFTALYSNTARAHQLGTTRDWVVIYFYDDHQQEGQHTVVSETHGPLVGRRVVRGLESACRRYYGLS
jgi:putative hydrolase